MLERLRDSASKLLDKIGRKLAFVNPNAITILSLPIAYTSLYTAVEGYRVATLALILLSAALDAIDGAVARASKKASKAGALLDSVCDRYCDAAIIAATYIACFGLSTEAMALAFAAFVGASLTSYVRARGEALGVSMRGVGLLERGDRVLYLAAALALKVLGLSIAAELMLYIFPVLTNMTAVHRLVFAYRRLWSAKTSF